MARSHFTPVRSGEFKVKLDAEERALLAALPDQLETLVTGAGGAPGTERLFPTAYVSDRDREEEYQRLMRDELIRGRIATLTTVRESANAERLTVPELDAWVRVINDARLVLGTLLDVSEDEDPFDIDPTSPTVHQRVAYTVLSALVADAVDALATALPPPERT